MTVARQWQQCSCWWEWGQHEHQPPQVPPAGWTSGLGREPLHRVAGKVRDEKGMYSYSFTTHPLMSHRALQTFSRRSGGPEDQTPHEGGPRDHYQWGKYCLLRYIFGPYIHSSTNPNIMWGLLHSSPLFYSSSRACWFRGDIGGGMFFS